MMSLTKHTAPEKVSQDGVLVEGIILGFHSNLLMKLGSLDLKRELTDASISIYIYIYKKSLIKKIKN